MDAMKYQEGWEVILEHMLKDVGIEPRPIKECGGYGRCYECRNLYYEYGDWDCRKDWIPEKFELDEDAFDRGWNLYQDDAPLYCKYFEQED